VIVVHPILTDFDKKLILNHLVFKNLQGNVDVDELFQTIKKFVDNDKRDDLYITFVIPDDSVFKRLGDDLYVDVTVDLYTALLGGDQLVDTLDGQVKLKVKPETQNGTKVRLKGKGFPVYKKEGQFGDLIVTYSVKLPTNLTEQQKEMFRKIQSMN
jgi:DnaJ-class molecular chaperone